MAIKNTETNYGSVAKFFHWLVSFIVIVLLCVGFFMDDFAKGSSLQDFAYMMHKSSGLLVLALMILRTIWMMKNPKPLLDNAAVWERFAEKFVHYGLYVLLIAMPLTGWIMSTAAGKSPVIYGIVAVPLPGIPESKAIAKFFHTTHTYLAWTILGFLTLHIGAALKHHYIDKDNVLRRMMPGVKVN